MNFTAGLDTQTDRRLVIPGRMVALRNITMSEEDSFLRRNGFGALVSGTALGGLAAYGSELIAIDGRTLASYASASGATYARGSTSGLTLTTDGIFNTGGWQDYFDCATSGGLTCYVWREYDLYLAAYSLRLAVKDETTGAIVLTPTSISTAGFRPRVVAVTGAFVVVYGDAGNLLRGRVVLTASPTSIGAETTLRTDLAAGTSTVAIDACASGANAFVAYSSNDGTTSLRAVTVTQSAGTPAVSAGPANILAVATIPAANIRGVAIANYTSTLIGVFAIMDSGVAAGNRGLLAAVVNSGMTVTAAAAQKDATAVVVAANAGSAHVCAALTGANLQVFSDGYNSNGVGTPPSLTAIRTTTLTSANAIAAGPSTLAVGVLATNGYNGPFISGKPMSLGGALFLPAQIRSMGTAALQNSWFLLDTSGVVAGKAMYGSFGRPRDVNYELCPSSLALSSTSAAVLEPQITLLSFDSGTNVSLSGMTRVDVSSLNPVPPVKTTLGSTLYVGGASLESYDGLSVTEAGFHLFPEYVLATTGGAGNVTAGVHGLVALYEWIDESGERHQSAPSVAIQYTAPGGALATVDIQTLMLTQKVSIPSTNVGVVLFATTAGGQTYYRVNSVATPVYSATSAAAVTITFNVADGTAGSPGVAATGLQAGELLYTTGGVLPNNAPPPCSIVAAHQERLFIDVSDDPYAFQYSQPRVNGFGLQWNETLRGRVESSGGPLKAYASLDDKFILFRPRRIGVLFGQGPGTTGLGGSYQLQDLPTDVGCSEPRSVLVMPEGVIFKSTSKGWYRLGRDLSLRWIGEGAQEWDDQGVTSAVLLDTLKECRFTTNDASGLTLVYFYGQKGADGVGQWGTYSNFTGVDAVWWPGGDTYVRATSTAIYKELPATSDGYAYGDGATTALGAIGNSPVPFTGSPIATVFQTGWLKPGEAITAFQRVWRVLLAGAAAGYPAPFSTLSTPTTPSDNFVVLVDGSGFPSGAQTAGTLVFGLGTANYFVYPQTWAVGGNNVSLDGGLGALGATLPAGTSVYGAHAFGAGGTLTVDFYFNGDDSTPYHTVTVSSVGDLVSGTAWAIRMVPHLQKSDSLMIKVTNTPAVSDPGASLNFSGMTLELGVKKGARRLPAAQTK